MHNADGNAVSADEIQHPYRQRPATDGGVFTSEKRVTEVTQAPCVAPFWKSSERTVPTLLCECTPARFLPPATGRDGCCDPAPLLSPDQWHHYHVPDCTSGSIEISD